MRNLCHKPHNHAFLHYFEKRVLTGQTNKRPSMPSPPSTKELHALPISAHVPHRALSWYGRWSHSRTRIWRQISRQKDESILQNNLIQMRTEAFWIFAKMWLFNIQIVMISYEKDFDFISFDCKNWLERKPEHNLDSRTRPRCCWSSGLRGRSWNTCATYKTSKVDFAKKLSITSMWRGHYLRHSGLRVTRMAMYKKVWNWQISNLLMMMTKFKNYCNVRWRERKKKLLSKCR